MIVEIADWDTLAALGDVAVIVKFWTMKRVMEVWTRDALVPVIVRV